MFAIEPANPHLSKTGVNNCGGGQKINLENSIKMAVRNKMGYPLVAFLLIIHSKGGETLWLLGLQIYFMVIFWDILAPTNVRTYIV